MIILYLCETDKTYSIKLFFLDHNLLIFKNENWTNPPMQPWGYKSKFYSIPILFNLYRTKVINHMQLARHCWYVRGYIWYREQKFGAMRFQTC